MKTDTRKYIITLNGGSSSIKFGLFAVSRQLRRVLTGKVERIGLPGTKLTATSAMTRQFHSVFLNASEPAGCVKAVLDFLEEKVGLNRVAAVAHRIVHGGVRYRQPHWVSSELLDALRDLCTLDPDHLPLEISLIEACTERDPELRQVACFDTAFHADMPRVATLMAVPRRYAAVGVQRYGFHGLSYKYLMEELDRVAGREAAHGRVILAHLGNGASLAAVSNGISMDTTMSLTPASGIPMSTRSGDLDPGYVSYVLQHERLSPDEFHRMVNCESGLLGVSEISPDVRDLLSCERSDERAADAIALFCYQVKKAIGAFAAVLGGVDTLVFSGGIGENSAAIRRRACDGLGFFDIVIDEARNASHAPVISEEGRAVTVRVITTDEEVQMARTVVKLLSGAPTGWPPDVHGA